VVPFQVKSWWTDDGRTKSDGNRPGELKIKKIKFILFTMYSLYFLYTVYKALKGKKNSLWSQEIKDN
jgi:hypothetical protein